MSEVLLDPAAIALSLRRIAAEIVERGRPRAGSPGGQALAAAPLRLVAIRKGGEHPTRVLAANLAELLGQPPLTGAVDITLYRDDAATALPNLRIGPSHLPFPVEGARLVLVDDVVSSGRTVRAAIDAVLDYGRPLRIELAVLVDRGGRELPIQPDFVGLVADVPAGRRVEVVLKKKGPGPDAEEPWALVVPTVPEATASRRGRGNPPPPSTT
jgi:pyrimidine operon attenuation protein/uracil phosphoribosyltransferase